MAGHFFNTIEHDVTGKPVNGAVVMVYAAGSNLTTFATIYSDDGVTVIDQAASPVTSNYLGFFQFWCNADSVDITVSYDGDIKATILDVEFVSDQAAAARDATVAAAADVSEDASDADQAKDEAEAAAVTAQGYATALVVYSGGYYYPTLADGLADTVSGEGFFIVTSSGLVQIGYNDGASGVVRAEFLTVASQGALPLAGGTMTGLVTLAADIGLRYTPGSDPVSPVDGQTWRTVSDLKHRLSSTTYSVVLDTLTQTLANKTLTAPTITSPTITGGSVDSATTGATATTGTNSTQLATCAFVRQEITGLGFSSFGLTLIDDANASAARSTLGAAASGANTDITSLAQSTSVVASGTVAADSIGYRGLPQNSQGGAYALALSDAGKHVSIAAGGITIPANVSVAFPIGTAIAIFNNSASAQSVAITSDTLRLAGTATTGTRSLLAYGLATLIKVASTTWVISGSVA